MAYEFLPYSQSMTMLTDLYELTMAYAHWKSEIQKEAVFCLSFRRNPFHGGYAVSCGLDYVMDVLENFRFEEEDLAFLSGLKGNDGLPLFSNEFLKALSAMPFECDVDAIPEGTLVFPFEPLVRVKGPIIQAQILESVLLNILSFQTLIATKSLRVAVATKGTPFLEFGLRRAQGFDGALAASRAAYIGGAAGTSNLLAGKIFGIPVGGTHAHSWVMSFDDELESFLKYAEAMPNNCVFLVDTYDTLSGVKKAVQAAKALQKRGHPLSGIRLDSGDLAYLSLKAREILDSNGLKEVKIFASNELDETVIESLGGQGAKVGLWGVGTKLVTASGDSALTSAYKLTAVREGKGAWKNRVKLSEQTSKLSIPGVQNVRRFRQGGENRADMIFDEGTDIEGRENIMVDPQDMTRQKRLPLDLEYEDLLVPIFRGGKRVYEKPSLQTIREKVKEEVKKFHGGIMRFVNPHQYPVGLEKSLFDLRTELILKSRE